MDITEKDVKDFQKLYKSKFGKEIDTLTARHKLTMLVLQMKTIYQPITQQEVDELAKKDMKKD